jgi:hypothetical protein
MKLSIIAPIFLLTTEAFHVPIPRYNAHRSGKLCMAETDEELDFMIDELDAHNFTDKMQKIESLLIHKVDSDDYREAMRRLNRKAHHLGMNIPPDFASDASHQPPFHLHGGDESMDKTAGSGMLLQHVELLIEHLDGDNFAESLDTMEPFLINEADDAFRENALKQIESKASSFGKSIPKDYGAKVDHNSP